MSAKPSRLLYAFAGPAWALRARLRFALDVRHEAHAAIAAQRVARLARMAEAGLTTWTHGARSVRADVARLMRCVAEEVEG
jgi:hypothetical protein